MKHPTRRDVPQYECDTSYNVIMYAVIVCQRPISTVIYRMRHALAGPLGSRIHKFHS
jgi:hypothetical protein